MSEQKTFDESFRLFVSERCENALKQARSNPEYSKHFDEMNRLSDRITEALGQEHKGLFFDYDSEEVSSLTIALDYAYRQGFRDGILLKEKLGQDVC